MSFGSTSFSGRWIKTFANFNEKLIKFMKNMQSTFSLEFYGSLHLLYAMNNFMILLLVKIRITELEILIVSFMCV